jgi:hypothetical protein
MKKEIIFAIVLLSLFGFTLLNIKLLDKMTKELLTVLEESLESAENGDWEKAIEKADEAEKIWDKADHYTHIVVRHSELDCTTDAFYEFVKALYGEEVGEAKGAYKSLSAHLKSIVTMEEITLGSIF